MTSPPTIIGGPLVHKPSISGKDVLFPTSALLIADPKSESSDEEYLLLNRGRSVDVVSSKTGSFLPFSFALPASFDDESWTMNAISVTTVGRDLVILGGGDGGVLFEWVWTTDRVGGLEPRRRLDVSALLENSESSERTEDKKDVPECEILQISCLREPKNAEHNVIFLLVRRRKDFVHLVGLTLTEDAKNTGSADGCEASVLCPIKTPPNTTHNPFLCLSSVVSPQNEQFCIVGSSDSITVHSSANKQTHSIPRSEHHLSSMTVNQTDICCGHADGKITILYDILSDASTLPRLDFVDKWCKPFDKTTVGVIQVLHWHAHPVSSLQYLNPNLLLSGGEEAVLLSWNVSRSSSSNLAPAHKLPRVCGGPLGILGVLASPSCSDVVLLGDDNTLSKVRSFDWGLEWRIVGLGVTPYSLEPKRQLVMDPAQFTPKRKVAPGPLANNHGDGGFSLQICPHTRLPIMSGLNAVPGSLQWFSPSDRLVLETLRVSSYNRTSRIDRQAPPSLVPRTGLFCINKDWLICAEGSATTLTSVGREVRSDGDQEVLNEITTLFFYKYNHLALGNKSTENTMGWELDSVMPFPHGRKYGITNMVLKNNVLVTTCVSSNAFWVWNCQQSPNKWKCAYKISSPSDPSRMTGACDLSEDASLLAVGYEGGKVALWEVSEGASLKKLRHCVGGDDVEKCLFGKKDHLYVCSRNSLEKRDLFGDTRVWEHKMKKKGVGILGLEIMTQKEEDEEVLVLAYAEPTPKGNKGQNTRVLVLNDSSGEVITKSSPSSQLVRKENSLKCEWTVPGKILAMSCENNIIYCFSEKMTLIELNIRNRGGDPNNTEETDIVLKKVVTPLSSGLAPKLEVLAEDVHRSKRKRNDEKIAQSGTDRYFGDSKSETDTAINTDVMSMEATTTGGFCRSFMEQVLRRKKLMRSIVVEDDEM